MIFTPESETDLVHADANGTEWLTVGGYPDPVGGSRWEEVRLAVTPKLKAQIRELVRAWDITEMVEHHRESCEACRDAWDGRHVTTVVMSTTVIRKTPMWWWTCGCGSVGSPQETEAAASDDADVHMTDNVGPIFT